MRFLFLLFFACTSLNGISQTILDKKKIDSAFNKLDTLKLPGLRQLDSTRNRINNRLESANGFAKSATSFADSLNQKAQLAPYRKRIDSAEQVLQKRLGKVQAQLTSRLDSLQSLELPTDKVEDQMKNLRASMDSLKNRKPIQDVQRAEARLKELQTKYSDQINDVGKKLTDGVQSAQSKLDSKLTDIQSDYKQRISTLEGAQGKINAKASELSSGQLPGLPNTNLPVGSTGQIPTLGSTPNLSLPSTGVVPGLQTPGLPTTQTGATIPNVDLPLVNTSNGLPAVGSFNPSMPTLPGQESINNFQSTLGEGTRIQGDITKYSKEATNLSKGNLSDTKELQTLAESQVETKELKKLNEQKAAIEKYREQSAKFRDPEAMRKELEKQSKDIAFDKLADQKIEVDKAVAQLNQHKEKFGSVKSINDLPKRRYNPMRDKTFRERALPGVSIDIQTGTNFLVDINPYLGYRLTERWVVGLGWNERIASNFSKGHYFMDQYRVYGTRFFAQFKVGSKLTLRGEVEQMNTLVKPSLTQTLDQPRRDWVWSYFVGIKQDFKISKKVNGNAQLLYNVYDPKRESPYAERISLRFGFEFPYKKPKKSDND